MLKIIDFPIVRGVEPKWDNQRSLEMNLWLCDKCEYYIDFCDGCPDRCTYTPKQEKGDNKDETDS